VRGLWQARAPAGRDPGRPGTRPRALLAGCAVSARSLPRRTRGERRASSGSSPTRGCRARRRTSCRCNSPRRAVYVEARHPVAVATPRRGAGGDRLIRKGHGRLLSTPRVLCSPMALPGQTSRRARTLDDLLVRTRVRDRAGPPPLPLQAARLATRNATLATAAAPSSTSSHSTTRCGSSCSTASWHARACVELRGLSLAVAAV